jgi:hypothetical protein
MHLALKVASVEERGVCDKRSGRECAPHNDTLPLAIPPRQADVASGYAIGCPRSSILLADCRT